MDCKAGARERLEHFRYPLVDLSHRIHAHPELGWEEEKASRWVAETLSDAGFRVQLGVFDLPTAVIARAGSGPLNIAFCAEYDALPEIGHACGHNVIAAMSVGAAIAAARVADDIGVTVTLLGTPAEEVGNAAGKMLMLERGAFDGVHAAMMAHTAPIDRATFPLIAGAMFDITYTGREAHASASPEQGINAADAMVVAQTAIGLLRQHIRSTDRIHGIVTKAGTAFNVIPALSAAKYMARSTTIEQLKSLIPRVHRCFEAGAIATGCSIRIDGGDKPYAEMVDDIELATIYRRNAQSLGRTFIDFEGGPAASTDMGNVSQVIPSIHPAIGINSLHAVNHQPEFTAHCVREEADKAVFDGALSLAYTAIEAASEGTLRQRLTSRQTARRTKSYSVS